MNEYTDLLVEAGAVSSALEGYDFDGTAAGSAAGLLNSLADAVDDLVARNDVTSVLEEKWRHTALAAMEERDALRAQLDGMTADRDSWKRLWERLDSGGAGRTGQHRPDLNPYRGAEVE